MITQLIQNLNLSESLMVVLDRTERQIKAEQLQIADNLFSDWFSNLSQVMQLPIKTILGFYGFYLYLTRYQAAKLSENCHI